MCSLPHRQLRNIRHVRQGISTEFTAAQAAQKYCFNNGKLPSAFTAAQAAQKNGRHPQPQLVGVHCRTGSSEKFRRLSLKLFEVHCRTGSSEIVYSVIKSHTNVHCRTGSSEMLHGCALLCKVCSLPHRQLRKGRDVFETSFSKFTAAQAAQKYTFISNIIS